MDFLLDPNIAYLFLLAGVLLSMLALVTPGTGILEVGAFFCLAAAGYAVYTMSINLWALIVLVLIHPWHGCGIDFPVRDRWLETGCQPGGSIRNVCVIRRVRVDRDHQDPSGSSYPSIA